VVRTDATATRSQAFSVMHVPQSGGCCWPSALAGDLDAEGIIKRDWISTWLKSPKLDYFALVAVKSIAGIRGVDTLFAPCAARTLTTNFIINKVAECYVEIVQVLAK
jgi:hypothetical protein